MSAFVILSLTLALVALGVMVVVARELLRNVRRLNAQIRSTSERLNPLSEELQSELAVTAVEVDALSKQVSRLEAPNTHIKRRRTRRRSRRRR